MGVNKVEYGDEVLMDLTEDTVTPETLAEGETATNAQGEKIVGTLPIVDLNSLPTVDKVESIYTYYDDPTDVIYDVDGIKWDNTFAFLDDKGQEIKSGKIHQHIPILAGENTTFEGEETHDGKVIKINLDTSKLLTVDKIRGIHNTNAIAEVETTESGICWDSSFQFYNDNNKLVQETDTTHKIPIVAGDNISFESNGVVVKINSKGGGSKSIIDVIELPTENINEEAFYRVLSAKWVSDGDVYNAFTCHCVETLPDTAEPATTDMVNITTYYNASDGGVYGYVDDMLAGYFGIPSGWYPAEMLFQTVGWHYGGVITDIKNSEGDVEFKVLLGYTLYTYKDGKWEAVKGVGKAGTGVNAEVFNGDNNQATGDYSHAEGDFTHAKGRNTHTEGEGTVATARNQHTQGRYNIEDTEERYAHIVGNGEDGNHSNAHTIDWQGNAWYQGKIYTGGTGQDDATELVGVDKIGEIYTNDGDMEITYADESGIAWVNTFGIYDDDGETIKYGALYQDLPIVAGNGIEFEVDEENQKVKINATGGGSSSVSLIGTWTIIDEPEIPTSDLPLEFTSNGTEYVALGYTSMGSSTWGINALSYQSPEGYYDAAYTNNPSGSYGISHGWSDEGYKYITITKEPTNAKAIAWLGNNTDAPKIELPKEEMPQIRFTSANGNGQENSTFYVDEEYPLKLTVEVTGGALQVGDQLQVCRRKRFDGSRANNFKRKYKLQRFEEYVVTEEDLDKRFLTVNIYHTGKRTEYGLFRDGKEPTISPLYLRIRRPKGNLQDNDSGQTVDAEFSNIVTIWKSYHRGNQAIRIY